MGDLDTAFGASFGCSEGMGENDGRNGLSGYRQLVQWSGLVMV